MSGGRWNYGQCNLGYDMYPIVTEWSEAHPHGNTEVT